eukprot:5360231-Amphidinium_carterae.1
MSETHKRNTSELKLAHVLGAHGQASTQGGSELEVIDEGVVEVNVGGEVDVGVDVEDGNGACASAAGQCTRHP